MIKKKEKRDKNMCKEKKKETSRSLVFLTEVGRGYGVEIQKGGV